jgi:hypothetical protein
LIKAWYSKTIFVFRLEVPRCMVNLSCKQLFPPVRTPRFNALHSRVRRAEYFTSAVIILYEYNFLYWQCTSAPQTKHVLWPSHEIDQLSVTSNFTKRSSFLALNRTRNRYRKVCGNDVHWRVEAWRMNRWKQLGYCMWVNCRLKYFRLLIS